MEKYGIEQAQFEAEEIKKKNPERTAKGYRQAEAELEKGEKDERPKLIIIYGPPSAGKLTVSQALSESTGIEIFHNHKTVDKVAKDIPFGTSEFWEKVVEERLREIEEKAKAGKDLIFTFAYNPKPVNDEFVTKVKKIAEENNIQLILVKLSCTEETLLDRVESESRKSYGKITDRETLRQKLETHDYNAQIEGDNSVCIDNTDKGPEEVARDIIERFDLES